MPVCEHLVQLWPVWPRVLLIKMAAPQTLQLFGKAGMHVYRLFLIRNCTILANRKLAQETLYTITFMMNEDNHPNLFICT